MGIALLADAEGGEDDVEDLFDVGMTDDVAKSLEGFAEVEGDEFGGGLGLEGGEGGGDVGFDAFEAAFVAGVDGDGMIEGEGAALQDNGADGIAEFGEAGAILTGGGNGNRGRLPVGMEGEVGFVEDEKVAMPRGGWDSQARA